MRSKLKTNENTRNHSHRINLRLWIGECFLTIILFIRIDFVATAYYYKHSYFWILYILIGFFFVCVFELVSVWNCLFGQWKDRKPWIAVKIKFIKAADFFWYFFCHFFVKKKGKWIRYLVVMRKITCKRIIFVFKYTRNALICQASMYSDLTFEYELKKNGAVRFFCQCHS